MTKPLFVFIGGGSASGKTTFTGQLRDELEALGVSAAVVSMDNYYFDKPADTSVQDYVNSYNLDTPDAIHLELLRQHLLALNSGQPTWLPRYCFKQAMCDAWYLQPGTQIILVEGIFALKFVQDFFSTESSINRLSVNIGIESYLILKQMRAKRNAKLFGQTRDDVELNDKTKVGPGFFRHTAAYARYADFDIVNQYIPEQLHKAVQSLAQVIKEKTQKPGILHEPASPRTTAEAQAYTPRSLFLEVDRTKFPVNNKALEQKIKCMV